MKWAMNELDRINQGTMRAAVPVYTTFDGLGAPERVALASIAAQSFAALADGGVVEAAAPTVAWAERSRAVLPGTVATEKALAVGQLVSGDVDAAVDTLAAVVAMAPRDAGIAAQYAVALYLQGDLALSRNEAERALSLDPAEALALRVLEALNHPAPEPVE